MAPCGKCLVKSLFCTLSGVWASSHILRGTMLAELASHFALQYAIGFLLLGALLWWVQSPWMAGVSACLALLCGAQVGEIWMTRPVARSEVFEDISILQFNVNYSNPRVPELAGWITNDTPRIPALIGETRPDIIVLQEVSTYMAEQLRPLERLYPYVIMAPKDGPFGAAIFSRIPIERQVRTPFLGSQNAYTMVHLRSPAHGIPFTLIEAHTKPPIGRVLAAQRNAELRHIAGLARYQLRPHCIVVGDLNITPYSPFYHDLERSSRLSNTMRGISIAGTWPSFLPASLRIPIDHMLVSEGIEVRQRRVEKDFGSDHLPVLTRLRLYHQG